TMTKLQRIHGHFFNWYDTHDLRPLEPVYVSTVDSGNLAGHLIALAQTSRDLVHRPPIGPGISEGIRDALHLLLDSLAPAGHPVHAVRSAAVARMREAIQAMSDLLDDSPASVHDWGRRLAELDGRGARLVGLPRARAAR